MSENQSTEEQSYSSKTYQSNNNESTSNCITPKCLGFSKNAVSDQKIESATSCDTSASELPNMSHLQTDKENNKDCSIKNNPKVYETQMGIGDKCPSRWLPETSGLQDATFSVKDTENSQVNILETEHDIDNDIGVDSNSLRTKQQKVISNLIMNKCDEKQYGTNDVPKCDAESQMSLQNNGERFNGTEREIRGKEAIEELASELNKAANTIQDFSQNVSYMF